MTASGVPSPPAGKTVGTRYNGVVMRIAAFLLAGLIALPVVAKNEDPNRILIIVDASASMATSWPGRRGDRLGAIRATLDTLVAALKPQKTPPLIAIRVFGDQRMPNDPEACDDTRILRTWTRDRDDDLNRTLDPIQPRGAGSLALALAAATSDLGRPNPRDLVLIFLDSLQTCGEDSGGAFDALTLNGEGAAVRIFGFGLSPTEAADLSTHANFQAVGSVSQLIQGTLLAVSQHLSLPPFLQDSIPLTVKVANSLSFKPTKLGVIGTWANDPLAVDLTRERPRLKGGPGTATMTISGEVSDETQKFLRVPVMPERSLDLECFEPAQVDLSIAFRQFGWGLSPILDVAWTRGSDDTLQLILQENGVPGASWFSSEIISGAVGSLSLPLPPRPMELSLQLRRAIGSADSLVAEIVFNSPRLSVTLDAVESAEPGSSVAVSWERVTHEGDLVTLVPADAAPETLGTTFDAVEGPPLDFSIPFDQCSYQFRYIDGQTFEVVATTPLEVRAPLAGLLISPPALGAQTVDVRWWGPAETRDIIALTALDQEGTDYLDWISPEDGSPARLRIPREPGDYEIRYLTAGKDVAASSLLKIEKAAASIEIPGTVEAGRRLKVAWTGPNDPDDFLVLVRKNGKLSRHLDFLFVSEGSPSSMAAPSKPGFYEIRYVTTHPREVLASATFEVLK